MLFEIGKGVLKHHALFGDLAPKIINDFFQDLLRSERARFTDSARRLVPLARDPGTARAERNAANGGLVSHNGELWKMIAQVSAVPTLHVMSPSVPSYDRQKRPKNVKEHGLFHFVAS